MRAREVATRTKRFAVTEKARKVEGLQRMIREFQQMVADLERQVQAEEERTGVKDRGHFNYSTFAKAAGQRRDNLMNSISDLRDKLESAIRDRDEAMADLGGNETVDVDRNRYAAPAASADLH
jgi:hypothetical protein